MSAYREFTGKSVEEALRNAREAFGAGLDDLDFEILTPGTRGVLGMGAEPARIVAAPRSALGGSAPKRDAAASQPLPPSPAREDTGGFGDRDRGPRREAGFGGGGDRDRGPRREGGTGGGFGSGGGDRDRGPRREGGTGGSFGGGGSLGGGGDRDRDRGPRREGGFGGPREQGPAERAPAADREAAADRPAGAVGQPDRGAAMELPDRGERGERPAGGGRDRGFGGREGRSAGRGPRPGGPGGDRRDGPGRGEGAGSPAPRRPERDGQERTDLTASEVDEVNAARGSLAAERADLEAAEASPEALKAGQEILEQLMRHLGFDVQVQVDSGETSRLNVVGEGDEKEALGALIGRKGERLSALQHLVNLMLSRKMDAWTRVLVDVEDYRGRRERQLRDLATRAAERVIETGKMLQLEPMPALERRWVHIALRDHPDVATHSIGEEPNRRIVVVPRSV